MIQIVCNYKIKSKRKKKEEKKFTKMFLNHPLKTKYKNNILYIC